MLNAVSIDADAAAPNARSSSQCLPWGTFFPDLIDRHEVAARPVAAEILLAERFASFARVPVFKSSEDREWTKLATGPPMYGSAVH